ncbi:MAG: DNA-directed RNA polymerase subunit beta [Ruminococcaceae bacterium]|nr:DNA-directed RNA polymerase subunit beta [Oscillospiraceae bacterium]
MTFSKINEVIDMPNLIEIQKDSYNWFVTEGLREVFKDMSAITDYSGNLVLSFIDYRLDSQPKYDVTECKARDTNYAAPLHVTARLLNKETGEIKESEVYMGDFPLMTDSGTFIINGAERAIVSQLVRSPGVYFEGTIDTKTGKPLFSSTIIPNRGAWLEYETAISDALYVRIDKNRKLPITTFIRALGYNSNQDIREAIGEEERLLATFDVDETKNTEDALVEVYKKLRPNEPVTIEGAKTYLEQLFFDAHRYDLSRVGRYKYNKKLALAKRIRGRVVSRDVVDPMTGEILAQAGEKLNKDLAERIERCGVSSVYITLAEHDNMELKVLSNGMVNLSDFVDFSAEELSELDREGINEMVSFEWLKSILEMNESKEEIRAALLEHCDDLIPKHITVDDILATVNYFIGLPYGVGNVDDIDHLGNRRIRSVGELLQNQFRIGFSRMERVIREKMTLQSQDSENITPVSIINNRPVTAAIKEFFGSSPLSQFMDQTNPLSELTHKRRLSALGPGGLSRDRASFEVRDVHYTHYGRMCPIETPEGPNIGLISYLATYAKINKYGFIEAPFRPIDKATGRVLDDVVYMTADEEDEYIVAQANEPLNADGTFANDKVHVRYLDSFQEIDKTKADFMDVSPKMVVSVATAMIPFLENDDTNRALMGSNMQKQAVPLLKPENPVVATGMEYKAAVDSGVVVLAKRSGTVTYVSADVIKVRAANGEIDEYELIKFTRSNHGTCINQRPIVKVGQNIVENEVIADGPATNTGEISLGRNALIGFMTWEGYNYEDAVLINERLVRDDIYTSIHIEEYEIESRDTKLGPEEITRDIPNVGDDALKDLDERGIIRIGAEVSAGDILVGKVTPKGETELTAEERLLRAIFGEKAREVRDTSLRVPHGEYGTIVDVKVFTRENSSELSPGVNVVVRCYIAQKRKISVGDKMAGRHGNKGVVSRILPSEDMPFLPDGTPLDIVLNPLGVPSRMNIGQVLEVHLGYAARALGWNICTPVFDGAHEADIRKCFELAEEYTKSDAYPDKDSSKLDFSRITFSQDAKTQLFDGRTGEPFDNPVTVGYMYYLKLHHLVDDKIHARSTGPYSLVTQQPLGGKAQFGGQRFGEMEVWALEAYGAAYTLQEILTVKSDDVVGRVKTYEAIVKGQNVPKSGVPESFKVLIKELQSLGLDVKVLDRNNEEIDLRQNFDEDDDIGLPPPAMPDDFNDGDLDGFGYEDENGDSIDDGEDDYSNDDYDDNEENM